MSIKTYMTCARPVFEVMRKMVIGESMQALTHEIGQSAETAYCEFYRELKQQEEDVEKFTLVAYALAALLDEKMLLLEWPGRVEWQQRPLQLQYFSEHVAGEGFYNRLERIKKDAANYQHVFLFYQYCLMFGFRGKLLDAPEELMSDMIMEGLRSIECVGDEMPFTECKSDSGKEEKALFYRYVGGSVMVSSAAMYSLFLVMSRYM